MVNADSERRSKAASRLIEVLVADSDPACSAGSISTTGARRDIFDCSTTTPPAPSREPLRHLFRVGRTAASAVARTYQGFSCSPLAARSKRLSAPNCGMCPRAGHQLAEAKLPQVGSRANGLPANVPIGGDAWLSNELLIALSGCQALSRARSRL